LRIESERIFARTWQYVGHTGQLAGSASFFTGWAGEIPIVVTRARDGQLRAFLNVCRHRGSLVAEGEGVRETLQCGYHAWTYALDGTLRAAPRADREDDFAADELGLVPVAIDTWGPFVFVNPDRGADPLGDALGEVPALLGELLDLDSLEHRFRIDWELTANWKVACENFLECYHCPVAHPGFSAVVDVSPDSYKLRTQGLTSSQFGPLRENGASAFSEGEVRRSQFHFVWPNFGINVFPGRPNLSCGPILPRGPERTARFLDYFFAPDVSQEWIDELLSLDEQVGREDTALIENVQRGIRSGILAEGRVMTASEPLIAHFQQLTADALQ
jgi:choline monooxygenase